MPPKIKEKLKQLPQQSLSQKDDLKCRDLIESFKKSIEVWFINGADDELTFWIIQDTCVQIILHGLHDFREMYEKNKNKSATYDSPLSTTITDEASYTDIDLCVLLKSIDAFEWILNAVNIRSTLKTPQCLDAALNYDTFNSSHSKFLNRNDHAMEQKNKLLLELWLREELHNSSKLCSFLQYLVSDKELLDEHYASGALLKQEKYANALVIGLSALETYQYGLLTQIDNLLKDRDKPELGHKRSNSQPNVIILPPTKKRPNIKDFTVNNPTKVFPIIRKTKSLPEIQQKSMDSSSVTVGSRRRCKTTTSIKRKHIKPLDISSVLEKTNSVTYSTGNSCYEDNQKPSTSQNSNWNCERSDITSLRFNSTDSITSVSTSTSMCSSESYTTPHNIQIINTDHIKIWTDQSADLRTKKSTTPFKVIPQTNHRTASSMSGHNSSKSVSPLNSLFSSMFSTPPSYTAWYTDHSSREDDECLETALDSISSDNSFLQNTPPAAPLQTATTKSGSTVFDKFLPKYGKKLRVKNLFDSISDSRLDKMSAEDSVFPPNPSLPKPAKNPQSLTEYLQRSNLSRNDTELEKENAHFRIAEAIISAMEHIKWNKQAPVIDRAAPMATDCLSSVNHLPQSKVPINANSTIKGEEFVPYVKEVYLEQLSAEDVGLSLISKFNENQLPKVSELKWLVSDTDTPQKLLPMPDITSSSNPDDHVVHSVTRGTKYWAPPRQQIIFTDHPTTDRNVLLRKQNFRCAGCGMLVSPQYVHSFRYCTYLGKYHCTGCHRNQISAIPAKILQAWDFKCYPVSVFAYRLIQQMSTFPLFYVPDLNPALYYHSKSLWNARKKRLQLKYIKDFISSCRFTVLEHFFESVPDYITSDFDNWSMADFLDVQSNSLQRSIDKLIDRCEAHVFNCVLCTARGFFCEHCHLDTVIYPWDARVERCALCGTCFHRKCWKSVSERCSRCQRISKRQEFDEAHG